MMLQKDQWVEIIDNASGELLQGYICNLREDSAEVHLAYPTCLEDSIVTAAIPPVSESYDGYVIADML